LKQKDLRRENRRIGDVVGETEEKYGECEEEGLPVTDKSEEAADLKKYIGSLQIFAPPPTDQTVKGGFNQERKEKILYYDCLTLISSKSIFPTYCH